MKDFIYLSPRLLEEPEEGFDLARVYAIEGDVVLYLIRTDKDELAIEEAELLGEVIDGKYVFKDEYAQDDYEYIRKVGAHAVENIYTDEQGNDIQIEKPYMFGLFA